MELSQGSSARTSPISEHPRPSMSLNWPSPSGNWEESASRAPGVGRRAERRIAECAAHTRAGITAGFAPARLGSGAGAARTPARCGARPPPRHLGLRRPRPVPPPRGLPRLGVPRCPGGGRTAARAAGEPGRAGAEDARGRTGGARSPPPPRPAARAAVDVTGARLPCAPLGRACAAGRRAHGPAGRRARGGLAREERRGGASKDGPRHPRPPASGFPRGKEVGGAGDLRRHGWIHLPNPVTPGI
nr:collagen alpha-1(I) chain-like isoform X1 [Equus asinus]